MSELYDDKRLDELVEEPACPPLPRQVEILDQKRRDDHPDPVVHEAGLAQLAQGVAQVLVGVGGGG